MAKEFVLSSEETKPSEVFIEARENYQKQSWRNRCRIYSASGPECLNFPVVHEGGTYGLPITEIKVDYSTPWLVKTERAITSAYESSAFFDFYKDELFDILESRLLSLFELDLQIIRFFLRKTGLSVELKLTEDYLPFTSRLFLADAGVYGADYREVLHPKRENSVLRDLGLEKPYFQVFARKHGFISDLSIMDLLFNEGPDSILYLKKL